MKTILTLSTLVLIALSLNASADDKIKTNNQPTVVHAPFVWGNAGTEVPVELGSLKAKNAMVPVAPFYFGSPDELISAADILQVPLAPFVYGSPEDLAPESLGFIKAVHGEVPVAPFIFGSADDEAPVLIEKIN